MFIDISACSSLFLMIKWNTVRKKQNNLSKKQDLSTVILTILHFSAIRQKTRDMIKFNTEKEERSNKNGLYS